MNRLTRIVPTAITLAAIAFHYIVPASLKNMRQDGRSGGSPNCRWGNEHNGQAYNTSPSQPSWSVSREWHLHVIIVPFV